MLSAVTGIKRASGLVLFSLVLAVACGNTNNNNQNNATQAGTGGVSAGVAGASAGSAGTGNASGSSAGGSSAGDSAAGGSGGDVGAGGDAGGEGPVEPLDRVELVRDKVPNKLDLLMMIDNSISMGDKQHLLADAMQHLVNRLVQPRCLDEQGTPTGQQAQPSGVCPLGSQPEFLPFNDIHAAVVTSSLGAHGAPGASDVCVSADDDDHAQLLGIIRPGLPNWNQQGFLVWDPTQMLSPVGIADPAVFSAGLAKTVEAAGDSGCGFEAALEGWYRFLVDPEPPLAVVVPTSGGQAQVQGISAAVLEQRAAFLRSDSVLGIVMLSDENDCSIVDSGYGYLIARTERMYRSTSACAVDPNDPCCQSCAESTARTGCPALASDSECAKGTTLAPGDDNLNLRCYQQKQRFGFDLLYPVQRYIDALTASQIHRRSDNALVANPIYESKNGAPPRSPEQVLLLGIVGVPWQDVADRDSLTANGLKFLSEDAPLSAERWDLILGDPAANKLPLDPFMVESIADRTTLGLPQSNPVVPIENLAPSSSTDPQANHINGHEQVNVDNIDLQFACTFALPTPIVCDAAAKSAGKACDCFDTDAVYNRPLCQPPTGGLPTTNQYFGKAYPGLRELMVLKGVGGHGIVASTCPKSADLQSDSYGYRPAMDALAGRVAKQIGRSCLNRDAHADAEGRTACSVITASNAATCSCPAALGLSPAPLEAAGPVLKELESVGYCGPGMSCDALCLCELTQHTGADLTACQTADQAPEAPGFCYLNAVKGEVHAGLAALAQDCVGAAPRRMRFTGGAPASGSIALLYCAE
jgi:hypothetical protein